MTAIDYHWRGTFTNEELAALHAEAFEHEVLAEDWQSLTAAHSLGWVTARRSDELVGFVNVIWDGAAHAWIQDTIVASGVRRGGVGTRMVKTAELAARSAGCEWLHVDFDEHLAPFYFDACGFTPTKAGLINLAATID